MDNEKKYKAYTSMVEVTRKWVTVMDAKSAFISALNVGLLTFIWMSAELGKSEGWSQGLVITATLISFLSLIFALKVVLPKASLKAVFGKGTSYNSNFKPVSFYGFVANNYSNKEGSKFIKDVEKLNEGDLAKEALEQHFVISHIVQNKANLITVAGGLFMLAIILTIIALMIEKVAG